MSQQERQRIHNFVYGTDVDGVPVPSDFELEAADAQKRAANPLQTLITACQRFSAAHGRCKDPECMDAIVDPQDWAEFDRAVLDAIGRR